MKVRRPSPYSDIAWVGARGVEFRSGMAAPNSHCALHHGIYHPDVKRVDHYDGAYVVTEHRVTICWDCRYE